MESCNTIILAEDMSHNEKQGSPDHPDSMLSGKIFFSKSNKNDQIQYLCNI